jgi:gamma-glutamyltranspeptidase/glutathione hydrolase
MLIGLNILEGFDLKKLGHNTPAYLHVLAESFKLAFADRIPYITDPRFYKDAPIAQLLSKEYAAARRSLIKLDRAIAGIAPPGDPRVGKAILSGHEIRYMEPGKTATAPAAHACEVTASKPHRCIADRFGNVVASRTASWWLRQRHGGGGRGQHSQQPRILFRT